LTVDNAIPAETGYGYIVPGPPLDGLARTVARFSEKPDAATALDLMASGALWNSGLFAWTGAVLMAQIRACTPEIAPHLPALDRGDVAAFFAAVSPSPSMSALLGAVRLPWSRALHLGRHRNADALARSGDLTARET
jgi:hypothetical protein